MAKSPIELAYRARTYVPSEEYRRGKHKKMYNPIRTTPALATAMTHLGRQGMGLETARERARQAVQEPEAQRYLTGLDWDELLAFLDTIAVFLKAGPQGRKEKGMRRFEDRRSDRLSSEEIGAAAQDLAEKHMRGDVVTNKLKKMTAHVTAARDKWEALAALARFYPRKGIPKAYVDELVGRLETADLRSFRQIVSQSLIFYEAGLIDRRRR
jgi:predicted small integral membrane protein